MNELGILAILLKAVNKPVPSPLDKSQFSRWLTGFIDAEGNFQVFLDRNYLRLAFRIRLHIDDVEILYAIKEFLGVGRVTLSKGEASCVFIISNVQDLLNVLFPLLSFSPPYFFFEKNREEKERPIQTIHYKMARLP